MASAILVNAYEIDQRPCAVKALGFPVAGSTYMPYKGSNSSLYGVVKYQGKYYATVETVAQLVTKANT